MALRMLSIILTDANRERTTYMKGNTQFLLRLIYSESVGFTLPIQNEVLHPVLFPRSSKGISGKTRSQRPLQRHLRDAAGKGRAFRFNPNQEPADAEGGRNGQARQAPGAWAALRR